jgi:hypothetical protein
MKPITQIWIIRHNLRHFAENSKRVQTNGQKILKLASLPLKLDPTTLSMLVCQNVNFGNMKQASLFKGDYAGLT